MIEAGDEVRRRALCAALEEAWTAPPDGERFLTGAGKADALLAFIEETWPRSASRPAR